MEEQFIRTQMLLGAPNMERLARSHVAVLGLGGVGGWCAEALCRSGVGALTLADQDTVSVSNLNRQNAALWSTVGMEKAQATALRLYRTAFCIGAINSVALSAAIDITDPDWNITLWAAVVWYSV